MGRHPHLGVFELEGPDDVADRAGRARARPAPSHLERRPFQHAERRRKAARRDCRGAGAGGATSCCSTSRPRRSISAISSRSSSLLARLNRERGVTMAISTHDLNLAASICRELVLLRDGRVLAAGPTRRRADAATTSARSTTSTPTCTCTTATGHLIVVPVARCPARHDTGRTVASRQASDSARRTDVDAVRSSALSPSCRCSVC